MLADPFNMNFHYDDRMREVPDNRDEMEQGIEVLVRRNSAMEQNCTDWVKMNGLIGAYYRVLGKLNESESTLKETIKIAQQLGLTKYVFINQLRLAHTYQWQEKFTLSNSLFDVLLDL
ncbi:hypothetical protein [Brevibacillus daliensis]|uniref:hypothetical protein n=1 Tax=Brevibacillus daliensis TaxID=2892995 RepID=UPI001E43E66A|nr:hypothetical protein [Brevibacillus daliensis]